MVLAVFPSRDTFPSGVSAMFALAAIVPVDDDASRSEHELQTMRTREQCAKWLQ